MAELMKEALKEMSVDPEMTMIKLRNTDEEKIRLGSKDLRPSS